jgi:hypothetical protein
MAMRRNSGKSATRAANETTTSNTRVAADRRRSRIPFEDLSKEGAATVSGSRVPVIGEQRVSPGASSVGNVFDRDTDIPSTDTLLGINVKSEIEASAR